MTKRLRRHLRGRRLQALIAMALVGMAGMGALVWVSAETYGNSSELETAQLSGKAQTVSSNAASNRSAVQFGGDAGSVDNFDGTQLDAAWSFENPSGNASLDVSGGNAVMNVPGGNDQWINIDKAPKLLRTMPDSNEWTIELTVAGSSRPSQSFAALTIYKDAANHIEWGQQGAGFLEGSGIINNDFTDAFASMASQFNYLRIRKVANTYYFDASANGTVWNNANVYNDTNKVLDNARVGVYAKNWGSVPYSFVMDRYAEYRRDAMPSVLASASTVQVSKQTGWDAINDTRAANFCGTDLGEMFRWQNRTYTVFGDTNRCDGRLWPSNVMSYSTDSNPADGIKYDGWVGGGSELFVEEPGNVTAIPTDGIGVGNNAYIYYMNINNWSPPQPTKWTCTSASIATATSANHAAWTKRQGTISWGGSSNFAIVAAHQIGSDVYLWGTTCGRFGSTKLMKVPATNILSKSSYQYLSGYNVDGTPQWSASEGAAITVAGGPTGELSVIYNKWLGRYVMAYLDERKAAIVMRESPTPWGSWSAPIVLTQAAQYPALYGGFMDEYYLGNEGQQVYWMQSLFGPYNTYLMKSTLTKK